MLKGIVRFVEAGVVKFTFLPNVTSISTYFAPTGTVLRIYYMDGSPLIAEFTATQSPSIELILT